MQPRSGGEVHGIEHVIVIGAGPAGLACAASLERRGASPLLVEQGDQAGAGWAARHSAVRLTTPRRMSSLPGYALESCHGRWPGAEEWSAYLHRYAERMRLRMRSDWRAESVTKRGSTWLVSSASETLPAQNVVIATGEDRVPTMPAIGGIHNFEGRLLHAANFKAVGDHKGERVLVVGAGTSGAEIATWLSRDPTISTHLSVRTRPVLLPRQILGVPTSTLGVIADRAPERVIDVVGDGVQLLAFGRIGSVLGSERHRLSERRRKRYAPTIDDGFAAALRCGRITVVPALAALECRAAILSDGARLMVDTVIAATGYRPGLESLVGSLGVLTPEGRPVTMEELRLHAPGLHFIGLRPRLGPLLRAGRREAERVADAIAGA